MKNKINGWLKTSRNIILATVCLFVALCIPAYMMALTLLQIGELKTSGVGALGDIMALVYWVVFHSSSILCISFGLAISIVYTIYLMDGE